MNQKLFFWPTYTIFPIPLRTSSHTFMTVYYHGEGNGNPLQYLDWRILWTEEPGGLESTGLQRVGHDWAISFSLSPIMSWSECLWLPKINEILSPELMAFSFPEISLNSSQINSPLSVLYFFNAVRTTFSFWVQLSFTVFWKVSPI